MTHLFVSPHPDDVALSCGGLIWKLRDAGERVTIVTIFSGCGAVIELTPYQREALGFGATDGARATGPNERADASLAAEAMAERRREERDFADLTGSALTLLDLPDAVFRGYQGDAELFGAADEGDRLPADLLDAEIELIRPHHIYFPLAVGEHVDHQLVRDLGLELLAASLRSSSGERLPRYAFYEDVPYCYRVGFAGLDDLPPGALRPLPQGASLSAEYVDVSDTIERKIEGIRAYGSQLDRQFGGIEGMAAAIRDGAIRTGAGVGVDAGAGTAGATVAAAERYWRL